MIENRRLAVFHAVAEHGSFSGAALTLDYTQSVVSHHVAQLERELGVSLFERGRRPVRLTPAGERLHVHARTILGATRAAEDEMRAIAGMQTGTLRLGAFLSACTTFAPAAISAFAAAHPRVEVRLEQLEPAASIPSLVAGELDLVVSWTDFTAADTPDPRLEGVHLADDPYRVALPPGHRLARRRAVRLGDLAGERFTGPRPQGQGLSYRSMLERMCRQEGFAPDIAYAVQDVTVARAFVAAGLSVSVMPELTLPNPRPDIVVKPLPALDPYRSVIAHWVKGRRVPGIEPMVDALRRAARAVVAP